MTIYVRTLNSDYELDVEGLRVRRVKGKSEPTPRFAPNGEWKTFEALLAYPTVGESFILKWPDGQPELRDHTISSRIVDIDDGPCEACWDEAEAGSSSLSSTLAGYFANLKGCQHSDRQHGGWLADEEPSEEELGGEAGGA